MSAKIAILAIAIVAFGLSVTTKAEDRTSDNPVASSTSISAERQFEALSPDSVIVVGGERMIKREYLARQARLRAEMVQKTIDMGAAAKALLESKQHAFLVSERAKLEAENAIARAAAQQVRARELAARAPDYDARVQQAIQLLQRAEAASPSEIAQMQNEARDILKVLDPAAARKFAQ